MKNRYEERSRCLAGIAVAGLLAVCTQAEAYTTVESIESEASGYSKITQTSNGKGTYYWKGNVEAGLADYDYVAKHQTRTPVNKDSEFTGHSFTVRNCTLADKSLGHVLTWNNAGLFLESGSWQLWDTFSYPTVSRFAGTVTVTAPSSKPFCICPTADGKSRAYHLGVIGKFKAAATAAAYVSHNDAYYVSKGNQNGMFFHITGDTTEYFGTFTAKTNGFLEVSGSEFPGTIAAEGGSTVLFSNQCMRVGTLMVAENAPITVALGFDANDETIVPFTITNALTRDANAPKIKVVLPNFSRLKNIASRRLNLVRFEFDAVPSLNDFEFEFDDNAERYCYFAEPVVDAENKAICLDIEPYISMRNNDATGYTSLYDLTESGKSTPTNWTDGQLPHADCAYLANKTLRTSPDADTDVTKAHLDVFPGKKIVFAGGSLSLKSKGFEATNAVAYGVWLSSYGSPSTQWLRGNFRFMGTDVASCIESQNKRTLEVEASISGNGTVRFWNGGSVNGPCPINVRGNNANFCGRFQVLGNKNKDVSIFYPCVTITNANALGSGSRSGGVDGAAILVYDGGKLRVDEDISYYDPLRCFYFCTGGRIGVKAGKEFEIRSRVKMGSNVENSGFAKDDEGTLTLGNEWLGFGDGNSGTPNDGVNNVIAVNGGTLKVGNSESVNGARVVLAEGTSLMVGSQLGAKGINNIKTEVPFSTTAKDGYVRMALDFGDQQPGDSFSKVLCTVTSTAANALRGKIKVAKPGRSYSVTVTEAEDGDKNVVFTANFVRTGMMLIFK